MSRPEKNTVEYIPLDCQFSDSIQAVENLYGNDGFVVWVKLLQKLGRTENYIIDVRTNLQWTLFFSLFCMSENRVIEIINTLAELECIDKNLWKQKIIYSENFVKRISVVYKKRKYELKNLKDLLNEKNISVELTGGFFQKNEVSGEKTTSLFDGNTQSKVKESKVNNNNDKSLLLRENKKIEKTTIKVEETNKKVYGEFKNVFLTDKNVENLKKLYLEKFNEAIEKLSSYISYSGRKYKDHYAVLKKNNWVYNEIFNAKNQQQKEEKSNDEFNYV